MTTTGELLQSDGGIQLLPEICLRIAEDVVSSDARFVLSLLQLSKVGIHNVSEGNRTKA
jgi:hypothetical protein